MTALLFHHQNQASLALGSAAAGSTYDWYPSVDKTVVPRAGPTPTVTRAGATATYFDSSGVLQTASANTPRFDHNPSTLASLGLLVEEARTNIVPDDPEDLTTWANNWAGGVTLTSNDTTAPDGNTTADKCARIDGPDGIRTNDQDLSTSTEYAFSFFVKNDDANRSSFILRNTDSNTNDSTLSFDWTAGVPSTQSSSNVSNIDYEACQDGWYRVSCTFTTDATDNTYSMVLTPEENGSGTEAVWFWGAMLEEGSFVTSYTSGVRATDQLNVTDMTFLDTGDGNTEAGTWYFEGSSFDADGSSRMFQLDDGGNTNFLKFVRDASLEMTVNTGTTGNAVVVRGTTIASNARFRGAMSYEQDNVHIAQDGISYGPDIDADFPLDTTMTTLSIGHRNGGLNPWNGHFGRLTYWPEAKSVSSVRALTAEAQGAAIGTTGCNIPMLTAAGII